ncbi:hypothetical protein BJ875DRAFT_458652 [Amylocarpus encephaloides]|uniref:Uncharacterized protein n=1 Tax=Amylocarpus encephaloides TaxID=45428 RepID=A0A9P7YL32_9HELO|nr:hypothetical protein BJ875DRAFT_458652 [Amylocarpus encephaloides]
MSTQQIFTCELLIEFGVGLTEIDYLGLTNLQYATRISGPSSRESRSSPTYFRALCEGDDPQVQDSSGDTALRIAIYYERKYSFLLLLDHGVDLQGTVSYCLLRS